MSPEQSHLDDWNGGSPTNLPDPDKQHYPERECPFCGATCKQLPAHLRKDCENKP